MQTPCAAGQAFPKRGAILAQIGTKYKPVRACVWRDQEPAGGIPETHVAQRFTDAIQGEFAKRCERQRNLNRFEFLAGSVNERKKCGSIERQSPTEPQKNAKCLGSTGPWRFLRVPAFSSRQAICFPSFRRSPGDGSLVSSVSPGLRSRPRAAHLRLRRQQKA